MLKQNREEVHFSVGQSCSSLAWLLTAGTVRNYSHFDCQGDFRANTMLQQKKRGSTFLSRPGLLKLNLIAAACFYFHLFFCHHKFFFGNFLPFLFQRECSSGPLRKHTSFSESSSWAWLPHFHLFSHSHLHFQRECNSGPYGQSSSRAWLPYFHLLVTFDKIGVGDPENAVTKQATRNWPWWANAKKEIGSPILNCHQYWIVTNIELSPILKLSPTSKLSPILNCHQHWIVTSSKNWSPMFSSNFHRRKTEGRVKKESKQWEVKSCWWVKIAPQIWIQGLHSEKLSLRCLKYLSD